MIFHGLTLFLLFYVYVYISSSGIKDHFLLFFSFDRQSTLPVHLVRVKDFNLYSHIIQFKCNQENQGYRRNQNNVIQGQRPDM